MALHKVQIMARDTSTANEDYINLTDHKLAVDIGTDLGTMQADIALMKTDLADVETLLRTTGIKLLPLDSSLDSIDVDKMSKFQFPFHRDRLCNELRQAFPRPYA